MESISIEYDTICSNEGEIQMDTLILENNILKVITIKETTEEIPYNGIDDDCDSETLDDDLDQDGYALVDDCNDANPNINPGVEEIIYDGIDNDCSDETLDDDLDQDGFVLAEDCDDLNPNINPDAQEITYNGKDDDCDELTLDDDLDEDGYALLDDCNDLDSLINPAAIEIPNNDIDEDCDGEDGTTNVHELGNSNINIYPNPSSTDITITGLNNLNYRIEIYDIRGALILTRINNNSFSVSNMASGVYILKMTNLNSRNFVVDKLYVKK